MDKFEKVFLEAHIYDNITKMILEENNVNHLMGEQPQSEEEIIQNRLDTYGNPLGFENPITSGINEFAIKKSQLYDELADDLKKKIVIKSN